MIPPGLFRLALATVVVVTHFSRLELGAAAVDLFFVLSGFWICRMFDAKYRHARRPGLVFMASRALRLYPVFLLFNGLALLLHLGLADATARGQSLLGVIPNTLIIGYASLPHAALSPAWSLDMELQFYLLMALPFPWIDTLVRHRWIILPLLLGVGGAYIALCLDSQTGTATMLPYAGFFALGLVAARGGPVPPALAGVSAAALIACLLALLGVRGLVVHGLDPAQFAWNPAVNVALALVAAPLALASARAGSSPGDRLWGELSYVVYCSHWLAVIVAAGLPASLGRVDHALVVMALVAATYAGSLVVLIGYDRPINRWREAWVARQLVTPGATPPHRAWRRRVPD